MSVVDTLESLIRLGALVKDAAHKLSGGRSINWTAFVASPEYKQIKTSVSDLKKEDFKF